MIVLVCAFAAGVTVGVLWQRWRAWPATIRADLEHTERLRTEAALQASIQRELRLRRDLAYTPPARRPVVQNIHGSDSYP